MWTAPELQRGVPQTPIASPLGEASLAAKTVQAGQPNSRSTCNEDLQRAGWQTCDRIACDHMSGLMSRSHMTAAKMVSATRGPNIAAISDTNGSRGVSRVLGSIDHTICSVSSKLPAFAGERYFSSPANSLGGCHIRCSQFFCSGAAMAARGGVAADADSSPSINGS